MAEGTAVLRRNRPGTKAKVRFTQQEYVNITVNKPPRLQNDVSFQWCGLTTGLLSTTCSQTTYRKGLTWKWPASYR